MLLRCAGLGPWRPFDTFETLPRISDPHPDLGWVNRPGSHQYARGDTEVRVSIRPDGTRKTLSHRGSPSVGLFGGSFFFGFGLSDIDVVGDQLAAARPNLTVQNHAVPGYGTLQSVLLYETLQSPPQTVVYGLVDLHDGRNAGAWSWLHALDRSARDQAWVQVPAAWWDGESLVCGGPIGYSHWEWSEHVALVDRLEHARNALHDRILRTKSETTIQLVLRFRDEVEADGGRFAVALLHAPSREGYYRRRLAEEGVTVHDLRHPRYPEWSIPDDGHPDARVHRDWARQLAEAL